MADENNANQKGFEKQKRTTVLLLAKKNKIKEVVVIGFCEYLGITTSSEMTQDEFDNKIQAFIKKPCCGGK
ncbi:MAG: hypothetical protein ACRC5H_07630 [Treponemataceae bacterium]